MDIGCVHHNPENYRSRYWLHKALVAVAKSVTGIDLYEPGVAYLNEIGYKVQVANAECFDYCDRQYNQEACCYRPVAKVLHDALSGAKVAYGKASSVDL